jgi:hypothetical protein
LYCGYPTEFAGSIQNNKKKYRNIKIINQSANFYKKKVCLVPQKGKGAKNLAGSYPTELVGLTQNPKKNYRNTKSTKRNKKLLKKIMFSTSKVKRSQKFE